MTTVLFLTLLIHRSLPPTWRSASGVLQPTVLKEAERNISAVFTAASKQQSPASPTREAESVSKEKESKKAHYLPTDTGGFRPN